MFHSDFQLQFIPWMKSLTMSFAILGSYSEVLINVVSFITYESIYLMFLFHNLSMALIMHFFFFLPSPPNDFTVQVYSTILTLTTLTCPFSFSSLHEITCICLKKSQWCMLYSPVVSTLFWMISSIQIFCSLDCSVTI